MSNRLTGISQVAKYFFVALLVPLFSLLNSCKEDTGTVGLNILPKNDILSAYQTDTTTIVTSMYLKDSTETNYAVSSLLGSYNDPIFGESKASIYAEVIPSVTSFVPWANGVNSSSLPDSAVLLLAMVPGAQPYGSLDAQTFVVYTTDSNIYADTVYYSTKTFKYNPVPIGEAQVSVSHALQTDTLRIKLSTAFINHFVAAIGSNQNGTTPYNWTTGFNPNVVKGLYITTANPLQLPGQGSILYINLYSSFSGINVYYHYTGANRDVDSAYYVIFPVGGTAGPYCSNFTHKYSTSPIGVSRPAGKRDSISAGQLVYVQSMGGVSGRINFPNLYKNWKKLGPVLINEAVLTFPVDQQDVSANFGPPANLYLLGTGSAWQPYSLPDEAQSYYGGAFTGNSYIFGITEYIQSIISGKNDSDRGLYIIPGNTSTTANSVVLYGAQHGLLPANKASLTIYYTPLTTTH